MKHLLNNLSEEEKNAIREQHSGGMKIMTENFRKLANSKLGDVRTIVESTNWHAQDLDSVLIPLGFKKSRDEKFKTTYWEMGQGDDRNYVNVSFDQSQFPKVTVSMNAVKDGKKLHGETKIAKDIDVRTIEAFAKKFMNIVFPSVIKEDITKEGRNNPLWVNLVSKLKSLSYPPKVITFESYYDEPSVPSQSLNWGTAKDKNGNYGFSIATTDSTQPIERMELFNSKDRKKQMEMHNWWKKNGYSTNGTNVQIKFSDADKLKSDIESFFKIYPPIG